MMKPDIYFDDVVYKLQRFGGITRYWNSVTELEKTYNIVRGVRAFFGWSIFGKEKLIPWLKFIPLISVRANIYHSSYQRPLMFKGSTKVVLTVHDLMYELFGKGIRRYVHSCYTKWAINQADVIICVSESTRQDMFSYYEKSRAKRVEVIHNGTDENLLSLEVNLPKRDYLLYVGKRVGCKNFMCQIRAVSEYCLSHDLQLLLVGGGKLTEAEILFLKEESLYDRTEHLVGYTDLEVRYLMKNAFALLFMSIYEGFGIPVVEAFRMGCPVLCLNNSSIPEIVGADYIGMFDEIDSRLVCEFLNKLYIESNRLELRNYMLFRSRGFYWKKSTEKHLKIYEELL